MISRIISDTLSEELIKESDPNNKSKNTLNTFQFGHNLM